MGSPTQTIEDAAPVPVERHRPLGPLLFELACADALGRASSRWPLAELEELTLGRSPAAFATLQGRALQLGLSDPYASSRHARLVASEDGWTIRDEGSTNGTLLNGARLVPGRPAPLGEGDLVEVGHTFFLFRVAARGAAAERVEAEAGRATLCPEWELELAKADRLARTTHTLLLLGESGSGKEVLARRIHQLSGRTGPLVSINCAALAENLLEVELFGHAKGAFSGAVGDRPGLIRAAHLGTLFLDELGDMPMGLQAKLLRVLEDRRVRPVGGEREHEVDVRVLAATHRDLSALAAEKRFRPDLLARLGLLPLRLPPLRDRREDLGLLLRALLTEGGRGPSTVRCTVEALRLLLSYRWPLNVRELRLAVLTAADLATLDPGGLAVIAPEHLPAAVRGVALPNEPAQSQPRLPPVAPQSPQATRPRPLSDPETALREQLVESLRRCAGNTAAAARDLGRARTQVQRWIARFGIDLEAIRRGEG